MGLLCTLVATSCGSVITSRKEAVERPHSWHGGLALLETGDSGEKCGEQGCSHGLGRSARSDVGGEG